MGDYRLQIRYIGTSLTILGAALVLYCGLKYVQPYTASKHMLPAQCTINTHQFSISRKNWRSTYVLCRCVEDDDDCDADDERHAKDKLDNYCTNGLCYSYFPCLRITVSYTSEVDDTRFSNASLYESYWQYRRSASNLVLSDLGEYCYKSPCDEDVDDNEWPVRLASGRPWTQLGSQIQCFYDPANPDKAIQDRPRLWQSVVSTAVPGGAFILGIVILLYSCGCLNCSYRRVPNEFV